MSTSRQAEKPDSSLPRAAPALARPATRLWAYVEQADPTGRQVVLVTTGNSRFEQSKIDEFVKRVAARGGHVRHHSFLRRGRIFVQMSHAGLLKEASGRSEEHR